MVDYIRLHFRYFLICISFFAVVLSIPLLPASWIKHKIKQQLPTANFPIVSGYLFQGSAENVSIISRGYKLLIGDIHWRIDGVSLYSFNPCVSFFVRNRADKVDGILCFNYFSNQIFLKKIIIHRLSIKKISELVGVEVRGIFKGKIDQLIINDKQLHRLNGNIFWENAQFNNGEKWLNLGTLLLSMTQDNVKTGLSVKWDDYLIDNKINPMDIDVTMTFVRSKLTSVNGYIQPKKLDDTSLLDTLELVSSRQHGSRYFLDQSF